MTIQDLWLKKNTARLGVGFALRGWLGANYNRALGFVAFSTYFAGQFVDLE
jgi:hypothetical protein